MEKNQEIEKIKRKTFKDYYHDPEFHARHVAYMKEKVRCDACNVEMRRSSIYRHYKTKKHEKNASKANSSEKKVDTKADIGSIQQELREIKDYLIAIINKEISKEDVKKLFDSLENGTVKYLPGISSEPKYAPGLSEEPKYAPSALSYV